MPSTDTTTKIISIPIEDEMRKAFIDYSMSVIVSRALPDARDGLKPVHRRVIYGMHSLGNYYNKPFKKSATIVGEVLGKYHPHGDHAVYYAMVRMAQSWSLRYPLIDGQGNYGSMDGDAPAAMRYTEARLTRIAKEMLVDIDMNTVDFQLNFDESLKEPTVLPARLPNLLVNGSAGIAVGMATNMPPHNLDEVINGVLAYIDNPDIAIEALTQHILAPDFPGGGIICGLEGVRKAYHTGKGRVVLRGKATIETPQGKKATIIVTEIPYGVNKAMMIAKTAQLINAKKLKGISDLRDESDKDGLRIVYELKKDAIPKVVLNNLYKYTDLQTTFNINNVAIRNGRPELFNLKSLIECFVTHRHEVITKRSQYALQKAQQRRHLLQGYTIALDHLNAIIALIKGSKDTQTAKHELITQYKLSDTQAKAILEMRLQRLTGMERHKINEAYKVVQSEIAELEGILAEKKRRMTIIKEELITLQQVAKSPRRTQIAAQFEGMTTEDVIPNERAIITISRQGYIKRTPLAAYKSQHRGGMGAKGVITKKDDVTEHLFAANTHDHLLIFTNKGQVYWKRIYELPESQKASQGRAIQNLIQITPGDHVCSVLAVDDLRKENAYIVFCTRKGKVKKTPLAQFSRPRSKGIRAITMASDDTLINTKVTTGQHHIIVALRSGRAIHFPETEIRSMGRSAAGVRGITLADAMDYAIGMVTIRDIDHAQLLVVSEKGYGKRSHVKDYRITHRGGKGIKAMQTTNRTGALVAIKTVKRDDELMIVKTSGIAIRTPINSLRILRRSTQGVRLIRLTKEEAIASVEKLREPKAVQHPILPKQ